MSIIEVPENEAANMDEAPAPEGGYTIKRPASRKGLTLKSHARIKVPDGEATPLDDGLPSITVRPPEDAVVNQALEALAKQGRLFQRGHQLVHVSAPPAGVAQKEPQGPTIVQASGAWMRLELSQVAAFYRHTEEELKRIMVPEWLPQLALEKSDFPGLPELYAVAETAVFLKDGTIHDTPGLDPSTGIYFAPLGKVPTIPLRLCLRSCLTSLSPAMKARVHGWLCS